MKRFVPYEGKGAAYCKKDRLLIQVSIGGGTGYTDWRLLRLLFSSSRRVRELRICIIHLCAGRELIQWHREVIRAMDRILCLREN